MLRQIQPALISIYSKAQKESFDVRVTDATTAASQASVMCSNADNKGLYNMCT